MLKRSVVAVVAALLCLACVGSALADDLYPPPWRGQPGTTYATWEFLTPNTNPPADQCFNPNGTPNMIVTPGTCMVWQEILDGRPGVWPLSGLIRIEIPNYPPPNPYKDVWIQITWKPDAEGGQPFVTAETPQAVGTLIQTVPIDVTGANATWYHSVFTLHFEPNPPCEIIIIQGSVWVDEIVIDTICVAPEPAGFAALVTGMVGIAGFAVRRRSRK